MERFLFVFSEYFRFNLFAAVLCCYVMCLIAYLYVMKAKANPTNEIELPKTTPKATTPSWLPHVDPIGL